MSSFWDNMIAPRPINENFDRHMVDVKQVNKYKDKIEQQAETIKQLRYERAQLLLQIARYREKEVADMAGVGSSSLDEIAASVAKFCGVTVDDMKSTMRVRKYLRPRVMFYLIAHHHLHGYKRMAKYLNRDHSTAINAVQHWRKHLDDYDLQFIESHKNQTL